ncbi:MAG: LPS-assembly protein LptD [Campylobacterales bacterium]
MFRVFLLIFLVFSPVFAKKLPFELSAKDVTIYKDRVEASGDVLIVGSGYVIHGDSASFYDTNKTLSMSGNIEVFKDGQMYMQTQNLKSNIDIKEGIVEPFFILDKSSGFWINSANASLEDDVYELQQCMFSSCEPQNPLWYIKNSSSSYDQNSTVVSGWNSTLYFWDTPVFYFPYIAMVTDDTRRSGLLIPEVGYSEQEGVYYEQPIYIAPMRSWDLELLPQIRTKRGEGLYSTFRFRDSDDSSGYIKAGFFKNNYEFQQRYDLEHDSVGGFEIQYENNSILENRWDFIKDDQAYVDFVHYNDVDYINLQRNSNIQIDKDKLTTSRVNYAATSQDHYFGIYNKYFIDNSVSNRDKTLQEYPTLHYHKYTNELIDGLVTYGLDYKYKNLHRKVGLNAEINEFNIPLGINLPLMSNFATISYYQYLYFNNTEYQTPHISSPNQPKEGRFARSYHVFRVESDLSREYSSFIHTLYLKASYTLPGFKSQSGYYPDFIELPTKQESVSIEASQFFYDKTLFDFLYHRVVQPIYIDEYETKYGFLHNELRYRYSRDVSFYNNLEYDHSSGDFVKSDSGVELEVFPYRFGFSHYYRDYPDEERSSFIVSSLDRDFSDFSIYGKIGYDYEGSVANWWEAGVYNSSRCFDYNFRVRKERVPVMKTGGSSYIDETKFYIELEFVPLFGVNMSQNNM